MYGGMENDALGWLLDAVAENARNSAILHIGVFSAVRPAEVFGLRWRSFCDDHIVIRDSAWEGKLLEISPRMGKLPENGRYRSGLSQEPPFCVGENNRRIFLRMH